VAIDGSQPVIADLGSTNGTFVNGDRVVGQASLAVGDELRIGSIPLEVVTSGAAASPPGERPTGSSPPTLRRVVNYFMALRSHPLRAVAVGLVTAVVVQLVARYILGTFFPAPTVASVVADVEPATVLVVATWNGQRESSGTGWVLDAAAGLVVTNHHVIEPGTTWTVTPAGGASQSAELVATAACDDVAVLRVPAMATSVRLGEQSALRGGDAVVAIGYPASAAHADNVAATAGVVSVPRTSIPTGGGLDYPNTIQTDAAINPGNSGGPLVNMRGELVGMNTLVGLEVENQAFAIGVDRIRELLPGLRDGVSSNWTGFAMYFPEEAELSQAGLPRGPIILGTIPGSPAAASGLDAAVYQVTAIEGRDFNPQLDMRDDFCRAVREAAGSGLGLRITPLAGFDEGGPIAPGEARDVEVALP
jgi:S1-C subfamily serine protease